MRLKETMGIVGFGRFGRFAAGHLRNRFDLLAFDKCDRRLEANEMGVRIGTLEEVCRSSVVLLCVPISEIRKTLIEIAPRLGEGSLVADTCSVKEYPVFQMKNLLPPYVEILGTHPLFGPDSPTEGLQGKKIALCPVRIRNLEAVEAFLERLGLSVLVCSPEEHDRRMASTQAVVHFLGRALLETGLARKEMATPSYDALVRIVETVGGNTRELSCDLQSFNRFTGEMRQGLIETLITTNRELSENGERTRRRKR
jgi:prephenate dehydrogenase